MAGVIALLVLVIPLLGCLIYKKKKKRKKTSYKVCVYTVSASDNSGLSF